MIVKYNTVSEEVAAKGVKDSYELKKQVLTSIPDPLVSVVVPTYQHRYFIEECIESILMQKTDFPFEIIIGEDFSTDGTREIVFNYAEKYPDKIRVITADYNVKQMANRVRCLKALRGKYIAQCDGDDYWTDPKKLQIQAAFMEKHSRYSLCYHSYRMLTNGQFSQNFPLRGRDFSEDELIELPSGITVSTKFYRNVYPRLEDKWFYKFCGDASTTALLGTFGECKFLDEIKPSIYRKHNNSEWTSKDKRSRYHLGKLVRMKVYKRFLDVGDERSALISLSALRSHLMNDQKLVTQPKKVLRVSLKQLVLRYKGVWLQIYYFPLVRTLRRMIRFLTGK